MRICIVGALARNGVIGKDNGLPWHVPADLRHFKNLTLGKPVIMGRKTFESIGRALPGRQNIVISRRPAAAGDVNTLSVDWVGSLEQALSVARGDEVMIIGGASIYALALARCSRMYLSCMDLEVEGDSFFPAYDTAEWAISERRVHTPGEVAPFGVVFKTLDRIV